MHNSDGNRDAMDSRMMPNWGEGGLGQGLTLGGEWKSFRVIEKKA